MEIFIGHDLFGFSGRHVLQLRVHDDKSTVEYSA